MQQVFKAFALLPLAYLTLKLTYEYKTLDF